VILLYVPQCSGGDARPVGTHAPTALSKLVIDLLAAIAVSNLHNGTMLVLGSR
jgi:hypothetical protein